MKKPLAENPLRRIKDEIRADADVARLRAPAAIKIKAPGATVTSSLQDASRRQCSIDELSRFHFTAFVNEAFQVLLKRAPDSAGFDAQLRLLSEGRSKIEVLGNLRYTSEGRAIGVRVPWLLPRYVLSKVMRVPILGYAVEWLVCLGGLPRILRHQRAADVYHAARNFEAVEKCRDLQAHVDAVRQQTNRLFNESNRLLDENNRLARDNESLSASVDRLSEGVNALHAESRRLANEGGQLRHLVLSMNHWLASLRQNLSALELAEAEQGRKSDALYAEVALRVLAADPSRPTRLENWAGRFAALLPKAAHVLDLCSGEDWLVRLLGFGMDATGVDTNSEIGLRARASGHTITVAEPSTVLARTADHSLHGLTALDTGSLLRRMPALTLLTTVRRVLNPGGLVLFGFCGVPGTIAERLEGRSDATLDCDLLFQALVAAGFIDVEQVPASDGANCVIARNPDSNRE